jgi:hypothetical protein
MVDPIGKRDQRPELVGHLGSPDHRHERSNGVDKDPPQGLNLPIQETTGGAWQEVWKGDDGGVAPMTAPKCVIDEEVEAVSETAGKVWIVCFLSWVEAQVLHHLYTRHDRRQSSAHGSHRIARVDLSLRAPEMAANHHFCSLIEQPLESGNGRQQTKVVRYLGATVIGRAEGNVEIGSHQDPAPGHRSQVFEGRNAVQPVPGPRWR